MAPETLPPLGLIAGRRQFPFMVAQSARAQGRFVAAVGFKGHTDPALAREVDVYKRIHLGQFNKLFKFLHRQGVKQVCFAGAIDKPKALDIRPDLRAVKLLLRIKSRGDDTLLRAVIREIETEGFEVVQGADLVPNLRGPLGVLTRRAPSSEELSNLEYAWSIAKQVGDLDIGQCVVVKKRMVTAVEAIEGTDEAIRRGGELGGPGCVVAKTVKPGQDERIDLPALGLKTIDGLIAVKASCLGYEAGKTLFFDYEESIRRADEAGLCILGLGPDGKLP